jgi:hypothetical protein
MTLTATRDHDRALAAGFDILEGGPVTRWARPDSAEVRRVLDIFGGGFRYTARRSLDARWATFYTMAEAVEWIGGTER